MRRVVRILVVLITVLIIIAVIGPLLIPIPPLTDTKPSTTLADPDSRFLEVNGISVHYKMQGHGEPVFVLLHGFAASVFSWREVTTPLAEMGTVIAFDRPAFGLTERPMPGEWEGENPYSPEAQVALTIGLMDKLGIQRAILVGNSAGGTIAMLTALQRPERVRALILVSPAVYVGGGAPSWIRLLFRLPQVDRLGVLIARNFARFGQQLGNTAWHDPSKLTLEVWEGYRKPLQAENWDRALWEFTKASGPSSLPSQLEKLSMPILVITGDNDRIVPTEQSIRLANELPNARLVIIPDCGHVAHEETPHQFMEATRAFVRTLR